MVVVLDVEAAEPDRQEPRSGGVGVQLGFDVGGVHDARQSSEGVVVIESEVVDEDLEAALVAAVGELGAGGVERPRAVRAAALS